MDGEASCLARCLLSTNFYSGHTWQMSFVCLLISCVCTSACMCVRVCLQVCVITHIPQHACVYEFCPRYQPYPSTLFEVGMLTSWCVHHASWPWIFLPLPPILHWNIGMLGMFCHIPLYMGSRLRSSCLQEKHLTCWIRPWPLPIYISKKLKFTELRYLC